jgi:hypothetical protein
MKTLVLVIAMASICGLGAAAQFHYAFDYDLPAGQDVEINVMNPMFGPTDFMLTVHDAYGAAIWSVSDTLASAESGYVVLSERVPYADYPWGVVTVDSADRLIFGLEYYKNDQLVSIDSVVTEVPELNTYETFWLGSYYSQVGYSETAFIVMNPWATTTSCTIRAYDNSGYNVYSQDFTLSPYESEYVELKDAIGSGGSLWGLLDVTMQYHAVVIALEYYGRGCSGLVIDNVTDFYY